MVEKKESKEKKANGEGFMKTILSLTALNSCKLSSLSISISKMPLVRIIEEIANKFFYPVGVVKDIS